MPIHLEANDLTIFGRQAWLVPGMQLTAEIHFDTSSVLEYLLSPGQKVA